jgi:hypothetical protein
MKKESVNTFNGGMNYDINPLMAPDNILTDCVNGAFVTFNGDELMLQNDAGNTKILVKAADGEIPAEYVKLPEDYYPLAVKEYGGILYIVSTDGDNVAFGSYPSPIAEKITGSLTQVDLSEGYKTLMENFTPGSSVVFTQASPIDYDASKISSKLGST